MRVAVDEIQELLLGLTDGVGVQELNSENLIRIIGLDFTLNGLP